jgi:hypothetical protein
MYALYDLLYHSYARLSIPFLLTAESFCRRSLGEGKKTKKLKKPKNPLDNVRKVC